MQTHPNLRPLVFWLACCLTLLLGAVVHADDARIKEMKYAYSEGYNLYQRNSFKKAIAYFTQAYRLAPNDDRYQRFRAAVSFFLAGCYDKLQQPRIARRWLLLYRKSKAADPRFRQEADALWERIRPRASAKPPPRRLIALRPPPPAAKDIGTERLYDLPLGRPVDNPPSREELERRINNPHHYNNTPPTPPMRIAAYVFLGLGGVALLVGASTHIAAATQDAQARELFAKGPQASVPAADITSRLQSAGTLQIASLSIYGAAVLFAATGTLLFFLSKSAQTTTPPTPPAISPTSPNPTAPTTAPSAPIPPTTPSKGLSLVVD